MPLPTVSNTYKRLSNKYRLLIINEDSHEELASFKLNRLTVYVVCSTLFVMLISLTVALLWFTPLKQLTPGYGTSYKAEAKFKLLKIQTDSLAKASAQQQNYISSIQVALTGNVPASGIDTTILQISKDTL